MNMNLSLNDYSDYKNVLSRAKLYCGENVILLQYPYNNKFVHFGAMGYLDYTKYLQLYDLKTANKHRSRYI